MLKAWIQIGRWPNALIAGTSVWLGLACLGQSFNGLFGFYGFLAMAFLAAAGNIHNDIVDLAIDRINRPHRALVRGALNISTAWVSATLLTLFSLFCAYQISLWHGILTLAMSVLLFFYNRKLKVMPLYGNMAVALLCALAVYFPECPSPPHFTWIPIVFAFLTTFAREIAKDCEDTLGDAALGAKTFPIVYGEKSAKHLVQALLWLVILFLPLPIYLGSYHKGYALMVSLAVLPVLGFILRKLYKSEINWNQIQKLLKGLMLMGMLAIAFGVLEILAF